MPLANLYAVVDSLESLGSFSHAHARDHDEIDDALVKAGLLTQPQRFPLDPINLNDGGANWGLLHQAKHNEMNGALGLTGDDMSKLDLRDPQQRDTMIGLNFAEHDSTHLALGI